MNTADPTAVALEAVLLYGVLPLWLLAGFGDWLCHRVQRIEHSTGLKESLLHLAMIAELGIGPAPVPKAKLSAAVIADTLKNRFEYWAKAQSARAAVTAEGGAKLAADHLESLVGSAQQT